MTIKFPGQQKFSVLAFLEPALFFQKKAGGETVPETKPAIAAKDTENQKLGRCDSLFGAGPGLFFGGVRC